MDDKDIDISRGEKSASEDEELQRANISAEERFVGHVHTSCERNLAS
jgi:hypothetical protein